MAMMTMMPNASVSCGMKNEMRRGRVFYSVVVWDAEAHKTGGIRESQRLNTDSVVTGQLRVLTF